MTETAMSEAAVGESEFVVVLVTIGTRPQGEEIARALVGEGLAACVNIVGPIRSIYSWEGKAAEDDEHLLVIKSRRALFAALEARVRALHSYEVPEVIAVPVVAGSAPYLEWLRAGTAGPQPS
jgi:periplasmic divalent cation tolerance protein